MALISKDSIIFVAGHRGMVGSAILRRLERDGYRHIITRSHGSLDLTDQAAVSAFFQVQAVDYVIIAAAKVGGIHANHTYPAEFIYQNVMIAANLIHEAYQAGIRRLLFLGSSCIYPKHAPQPMQEEYLLSGQLEPTNEPYALAKIAGINLCESYNRQFGTRYRALMPTNLYGPNDTYDLENSHVLPALIRKFHLAHLAAKGDGTAIKQDVAIYGTITGDFAAVLAAIAHQHGKQLDGWPDFSTVGASAAKPGVTLWGTGAPKREFLHVDDLAEACLFTMQVPDDVWQRVCTPTSATQLPRDQNRSLISYLNVGTGSDVTIRELAACIQEVVGFKGEVHWDASKPDGAPRKLLDVSRLEQCGWKARIGLQAGIVHTYQHYLTATSRKGKL